MPLSAPNIVSDANATDTALSSTLAIASVGIATLTMLETLLPAAAREVEHESKSLSLYFSTLIDYVNTKDPPPYVLEAISGIIVAMQFQDRNSQIMENAASILQRYRRLLEDVSGNIETLRQNHTNTHENITKALNSILSGIRLSDIRTRYVEALKKANIHSDTHATNQAHTPNDNIELF